jgi:hypothetical protein
VPPFYDSLIAKVISYGETRDEAMARMRQALDELVIEGIRTNTALHRELVRDASFMAGGVSIHYLESKLEEAALSWLQLRLPCHRGRRGGLEDALLGAGALSVTLEDAGDQPLLEPGVGETPLWQASCG